VNNPHLLLLNVPQILKTPPGIYYFGGNRCLVIGGRDYGGFKSHLILFIIQQIFPASFIESNRDWYLITSSSDIPVEYHGVRNGFEYSFCFVLFCGGDFLFCSFSLLFAAIWSWKLPFQRHHFGAQTFHVAWHFATRVPLGIV